MDCRHPSFSNKIILIFIHINKNNHVITSVCLENFLSSCTQLQTILEDRKVRSYSDQKWITQKFALSQSIYFFFISVHPEVLQMNSRNTIVTFCGFEQAVVLLSGDLLVLSNDTALGKDTYVYQCSIRQRICRILHKMSCYSGLNHVSLVSSEEAPPEEEEAPVEASAEATEETETKDEEPTGDAEVSLYSQIRAVHIIFSISF